MIKFFNAFFPPTTVQPTTLPTRLNHPGIQQLMNAVHNGTHAEAMIEDCKCMMVRYAPSEHITFNLMINGEMSNTRMELPMKELLRKWDRGEYAIRKGYLVKV